MTISDLFAIYIITIMILNINRTNRPDLIYIVYLYSNTIV